MSEKTPKVVNKTKVVTDVVTVFANGSIFEGWEDLQVTRELNTAASDFSFQATDKWRTSGTSWRLQPGDKIHIHVGTQSFFTGYVEKMDCSIAAEKRTFTISGRSKTGDLVDCSAIGSQFSGLTLREIAVKLCQPFNVKAVMKANPDKVFDTITIQQGETVFSVLEKLAKQCKVLMYASYDGNLVFAPQGEARTSSGLVQGVNLLSGKASYDNSNRFSEYIVKAQDLSFLGSAKQSTQSTGSVRDFGVTRYRPLVLVSEQSADGAGSENRANYEAKIRAAKALEVEVEVQGWFQSDFTPWEINRLVRVDAGFLGVRRQMLIKKIVLNKNNSGTTSNMNLIRADAYLFDNKNVKKEDPLGWAKVLKK